MTATKPIYIATRGSALALAQANQILAQCRGLFPDETFDLKIIKTTGDKLQTASLASAELPKGLFTKEIEEALLSREADLAVHSLKDLPTELPAGLKLGAVTRRADVRDVIVYRHSDFPSPLLLSSLPNGAVVATSSTRRAAQVLERRPDLKVVPIRGNVGTRLKKLAEQTELSATLLAAAGLARLGFQIDSAGRLSGEGIPDGLCATAMNLDEMLPCVGQAAIGIEIRENDPRLEAVCARLNDSATETCVRAERAFLRAMGGGCHLAVAAYAELADDQLRLRGVSFLANAPRRGEATGSAAGAESLGVQLARTLLA